MTELHTIAFTADDLDRLFACVEYSLGAVDDLPEDRAELQKLRSLIMRADKEE